MIRSPDTGIGIKGTRRTSVLYPVIVSTPGIERNKSLGNGTHDNPRDLIEAHATDPSAKIGLFERGPGKYDLKFTGTIIPAEVRQNGTLDDAVNRLKSATHTVVFTSPSTK